MPPSSCSGDLVSSGLEVEPKCLDVPPDRTSLASTSGSESNPTPANYTQQQVYYQNTEQQ